MAKREPHATVYLRVTPAMRDRLDRYVNLTRRPSAARRALNDACVELLTLALDQAERELAENLTRALGGAR